MRPPGQRQLGGKLNPLSNQGKPRKNSQGGGGRGGDRGQAVAASGPLNGRVQKGSRKGGELQKDHQRLKGGPIKKRNSCRDVGKEAKLPLTGWCATRGNPPVEKGGGGTGSKKGNEQTFSQKKSSILMWFSSTPTAGKRLRAKKGGEPGEMGGGGGLEGKDKSKGVCGLDNMGETTRVKRFKPYAKNHGRTGFGRKWGSTYMNKSVSKS